MENNTTEVVFKEKKYNEGWVLNIVKNNETVLTTSLYNDSGTFVELKAFNIKLENDLEMFRIYIKWFEDNPVKNLQKMLKLKIRK